MTAIHGFLLSSGFTVCIVCIIIYLADTNAPRHLLDWLFADHNDEVERAKAAAFSAALVRNRVQLKLSPPPWARKLGL